MNIKLLVSMANDIGEFFTAEHSRKEDASKAVLNHLKRYWEPRMRVQIAEHYRAGGEGLSEVARAAVAQLAAEPARIESDLPEMHHK